MLERTDRAKLNEWHSYLLWTRHLQLLVLRNCLSECTALTISLWATDSVGMMPFRHPITSVVGRPISVKQNAQPTMEELERYQVLYIEELMRIWEYVAIGQLSHVLTHCTATTRTSMRLVEKGILLSSADQEDNFCFASCHIFITGWGGGTHCRACVGLHSFEYTFARELLCHDETDQYKVAIRR